MANNNKKVLDLPFFELLNQSPVTSTATSAMTATEDGDDRYIYYLNNQTFYRYDTHGDTWQQLPNSPVAMSNFVAMKYTNNRGFHGRILSATSTTVQIPSLRGSMFDGKTLKVLMGPGAGQERTLTFVSETVHDAGVMTAVSSSGVFSITDSTKRWKVNQWSGYTMAITHGTDATQYKKILYNDATTLYVYNVDMQVYDPWNNSYWIAATPYAVPVALNSHYEIRSATYSVSAWDTIPDYRSSFTTLTGGIFVLTSSGSAPFATLQYYDVIHGNWVYKSVPQSLFAAAVGTDATVERVPRNATGPLLSNTAAGTISGTSRTITDSNLNLEYDFYANYRIEITAGTGRGQNRRIHAHTANTFTVHKDWDVTPSTDSQYKIYPDYNKLWFVGNGNATTLAYDIENDYWMQGHCFDDGVVGGVFAKMDGWLPVAINPGTTGAYIAAGIQSINPVPTAAGSGYVVGDYLNCAVGGTGAQVRVTSITGGGAVTGLELVHTGTVTGYTVGTGRATTAATGSGTGCTIEITAVGATSLITTATVHWFKAGDQVTFSGCTEAAWNTTYTVLGVPSTTTFCVLPGSATAAQVAVKPQGTTYLYDASKNWIVNEHAGRIIHMTTTGYNGTSQIRWIANNTANTINIGGGTAWTAGANGTSKYVIYDAKAFGTDEQRREDNMKSYGWANASLSSTTVLADPSKNWIPGMWANYVMRIEAGTGFGSGRITIANNTGNTLTFASSIGFTPQDNTKYEIADTWGFCTSSGTAQVIDTTKNWPASFFATKRIRAVAGSSTSTESAITTHTGTTISGTFNSDITTAYAILGNQNFGAGIDLLSNWGSSNPNKKARYLLAARGGGNPQIQIYDIAKNKWMLGVFTAPMFELMTTGSSYAYDGNNTIYMTRTGNSLVNRIFKFNIDNFTMDTFATTTWVSGTTHIGNFMEVMKDPTGEFQFVYLMQTNGTLFSRTLVI